MDDRPAGSVPFRFFTNVLFLAILFVSGVLFFSLVRNNPFWHSGDFLYLSQALKIDDSWREIFATNPYQTFQPLVNAVFFLEFKLFGLNAWYFFLFNITIHVFNAFLVYLIVFTLLRSNLIAVLSSLLFVFAVGNYGKAVMVASGIGDLLITLLTLLTLLLYFKNEREKGGRMLSPWWVGSLIFFLLSLLTKATSFSLLGCMLAFNLFFREETGKRVLHKNFLVIALVALAVLIIKVSILKHLPGREDMNLYLPMIIRNFGSYLVRMVFPIHYSRSVADAGPVIQFVYKLASEIRLFTFLCILSYSVFGFIFGNRAIRFFITWTYITVLPFCFFNFPRDWLNIRYLYLVSIGFSMLLASGTVLASRLLHQRSWRRLLPYLVLVMFVLLSHMIMYNLDKHYEALAGTEKVRALRASFMEEYRQAGYQYPKTP